MEVALLANFKKIIVAGPLVIQAIYPAPNPRDSVGVRQGKKALSSLAQQRMNLKYCWQKLELAIAANFASGDIYATLTYDDDHLPTTRQQAVKRIQAFWRKLRKGRGNDLRYIYVTEHRHGDGRWHHHVLINSTGDDYDIIRKAWGQGAVEFRSLQFDREKNYETLARYFCKEQRDGVGDRLWSGSRNLNKPEKECFRVPNDIQLEAPESALVFMDTGNVTTAYGHFHYMKYMVDGSPKAKPTRRKRRRG